MMKYRKTGKFKLGFLALLLSVLFVACGSGASDADRQIKSKTDLKGAVIGVQLGTTSDGLATELEKEGGGTKVERYNKGADAIQALLQGKIDCMVTDEAPAVAFQRVNPSLRILPETFDASSFAICVAKDHAELQQSINHAIRILKENGVIDSIVNRHLERGIAVAYTPKTSEVKKVGPEALQKLGLKTSLRFATNATFEPFEYYQNGKIVGIDKSNVRWVIHYNMPKSIESFYQEISPFGNTLASRWECPTDFPFYFYENVIIFLKIISDDL